MHRKDSVFRIEVRYCDQLRVGHVEAPDVLDKVQVLPGLAVFVAPLQEFSERLIAAFVNPFGTSEQVALSGKHHRIAAAHLAPLSFLGWRYPPCSNYPAWA